MASSPPQGLVLGDLGTHHWRMLDAHPTCLAVTTQGDYFRVKTHLVALHRFRGTVELFAEFEEAAAHQAPGLMPGATQGTLAGPAGHKKALSAQEISALIRAAAAYVLGSPVADDDPLSGAGLDSLGENQISHFA